MIVIVLAAVLQIDALVEQLGAEDIDARERAVAALKKCGRAALPKLEALVTDDVEVRERLRGVIAWLRRLTTSEGIVVEFTVDGAGGMARTMAAMDPKRWRRARNRIERRRFESGEESYLCFVDAGRPIEWHPEEYDGWREVVLRDLARPVDADVPAVYHLLVRGGGFAFALEKLESLRGRDPLLDPVIERAIERQRRKE